MTRELAVVMARELVKLCERALEPEVCGIPNYWPELTITGQDVQDLRDVLSVLIEEPPARGNVTVPRELLQEAADEIAFQDQQWLNEDAMGLRTTPPRVNRLLGKLRALLGGQL